MTGSSAARRHMAPTRGGILLPIADVISHIATSTAQHWKLHIQKRIAARVHAQATDADKESLEAYRREAFMTIGITAGPLEPAKDLECPECAFTFPSKQAMRMHHVQKHGGSHVAQLYVHSSVCRGCLKDFLTRSRALRHLKTVNHCLSTLRCALPQPDSSHDLFSTEQAKGVELIRLHYTPVSLVSGPRLRQPPGQAALPPPPNGDFAPEALAQLQPRQDPDADNNFGSLADIASNPAQQNVHDITPHLGPVRVALLLYGGRRRPGDVAHFIEKTVASPRLKHPGTITHK